MFFDLICWMFVLYKLVKHFLTPGSYFLVLGVIPGSWRYTLICLSGKVLLEGCYSGFEISAVMATTDFVRELILGLGFLE
jgi:hypothetical protein